MIKNAVTAVHHTVTVCSTGKQKAKAALSTTDEIVNASLCKAAILIVAETSVHGSHEHTVLDGYTSDGDRIFQMFVLRVHNLFLLF